MVVPTVLTQGVATPADAEARSGSKSTIMPAGSKIEQRNRALIAFTLLTGARDGATASLKLKHRYR